MQGMRAGEKKRAGVKEGADVEGWPEPDAWRNIGGPGQPDTAAGVVEGREVRDSVSGALFTQNVSIYQMGTSDFLKGFTVQKVVQKPGWHESPDWSQALVKANDFDRFKALQ